MSEGAESFQARVVLRRTRGDVGIDKLGRMC